MTECEEGLETEGKALYGSIQDLRRATETLNFLHHDANMKTDQLNSLARPSTVSLGTSKTLVNVQSEPHIQPKTLHMWIDASLQGNCARSSTKKVHLQMTKLRALLKLK